ADPQPLLLTQEQAMYAAFGSVGLLAVGLVAAGPDFKQGRTVTSEMKSIDVCPTACDLLGVESKFAKGQVMKALYG
ncbi:MAG: hypothetical protein O7E54_02055, partial [Planctomycetota bacterium]|nr:hypothetical protein [Planctomycetota bacterium]